MKSVSLSPGYTPHGYWQATALSSQSLPFARLDKPSYANDYINRCMSVALLEFVMNLSVIWLYNIVILQSARGKYKRIKDKRNIAEYLSVNVKLFIFFMTHSHLYFPSIYAVFLLYCSHFKDGPQRNHFNSVG